MGYRRVYYAKLYRRPIISSDSKLLSNTLRHAKADELEVYLNHIEHNVLLRVIDDGVGFDVDNQKAGSYGLMNIRERIGAVGGTLKISVLKIKEQVLK